MNFLLPVFINSQKSIEDKLFCLKHNIQLYYNDLFKGGDKLELNEKSYKNIINIFFILEMYTSLELHTKNLIKITYKNYKKLIIDHTFLSNFFVKVIDKQYVRECISKDIKNNKEQNFFEIDFGNAFTFSNSMDLDEFYKLLKNLNLKSDDLKDFIKNDSKLKEHINILRELGIPILQELKKSDSLSDIEKYIKNISLYRHHYAHSSNELPELYNKEQMIAYVLFFIRVCELLTKYVSDQVSHRLVKHYTNIEKCQIIPIEQIKYENNPTRGKYCSRGIINISEPLSFDNKSIFIKRDDSEEISLINISSDAEQIEEVDTGENIKVNEMRNGKYSIPFNTSIKISKRKKYHLYLLAYEDREHQIIFK